MLIVKGNQKGSSREYNREYAGGSGKEAAVNAVTENNIK